MPALDTMDLKIPAHIAVIMDGNGRWAKARGIPRSLGHRAGMGALRRAVEDCADLGVKYLTVYALSTENWKRPEDEVSYLMKLLRDYLEKEVVKLKENNIRLRMLGDMSVFSEALRQSIYKAEADTAECSGMQLIIALNYGGRQELVAAARRLAEDVKKGVLTPENIDNDLFQNKMFLPDIPDPDLVIRTSGEMRLSNFLLWQIAYSEFYVTDLLWPDFRRKHLLDAISAYSKRDRRFGGLT